QDVEMFERVLDRMLDNEQQSADV
ncbi:MAG: hypothetical protein JWL72_992, partial [Ilumatobacteraceae bacterium]|nr:hypothetical protein [Ilumatobacteraceae bacterium]